MFRLQVSNNFGYTGSATLKEIDVNGLERVGLTVLLHSLSMAMRMRNTAAHQHRTQIMVDCIHLHPD